MFMDEEIHGSTPQLIYRFNILIRIPAGFFVESDKFIWNWKGPRIAKMILEKKEQSWRSYTSQFWNLLQNNSNQDSEVVI